MNLRLLNFIGYLISKAITTINEYENSSIYNENNNTNSEEDNNNHYAITSVHVNEYGKK